MRIRKWIKPVGISFVCALMASGCGAMRGRKSAAVDDDFLTMEPLEGDYALSARFDPGNRVMGVELPTVFFAYDSFQIAPEELRKLDAVAAELRRNPGYRLVVEGHCDERGSREYNLSLGEHRALAVRAYLIGLGIDGSRIQTSSYGKEKPAVMGHGESVWRLNRRAEFVLYN